MLSDLPVQLVYEVFKVQVLECHNYLTVLWQSVIF